MFINKVVIITDGVNGIGKYIKEKSSLLYKCSSLYITQNK